MDSVLRLSVTVLILFCAACGFKRGDPKGTSEAQYTVACYYFPNYHPDARNAARYGEGWTEWELVKSARPRFDGHRQPRVPVWGYDDESDPDRMALRIDAAADHGIDAFIFDWYYYDDGPFLQRALEEGFMKAANVGRMKFGLMWANHDWVELFPYRVRDGRELHYPGKVSLQTWKEICDLVIERYFRHSSYWCIDGAPYFSFFDLNKFFDGWKDADEIKTSLDYLRIRTKAAGFPDLHLNAVVFMDLSVGGETVADIPALLAYLGFSSITSYIWIMHVPMDSFPEYPYEKMATAYFGYAEEAVRRFEPLAFFPNVTAGWDSSPRCDPDTAYAYYGYPCTPVIQDNTPRAFEQALLRCREYLERHPGSGKIMTLNAWNEWTEGSYLEPDTVYGMQYLKALQSIFGQ